MSVVGKFSLMYKDEPEAECFQAHKDLADRFEKQKVAFKYLRYMSSATRTTDSLAPYACALESVQSFQWPGNSKPSSLDTIDLFADSNAVTRAVSEAVASHARRGHDSLLAFGFNDARLEKYEKPTADDLKTFASAESHVETLQDAHTKGTVFVRDASNFIKEEIVLASFSCHKDIFNCLKAGLTLARSMVLRAHFQWAVNMRFRGRISNFLDFLGSFGAPTQAPRRRSRSPRQEPMYY